jgi:MoaA/NifB/PqqE/SkfB family radical SAM enzyme
MKIRKLQVKIELTKKCNLDCKHCSSRAGLGSGAEISPKYIDRILEDSAAIERIVLTGGEPFYCSHFFDTLEKVNKAGFLPSVYTSGSFEKKPTIFRDLDGKISKLIVSLHGPEIIHDRITGSPGSYKSAMGFLNEAKASQMPIAIHVVALRENVELLPILVSQLKDLGFCDISVLRYVPQGRGADKSIEPPTKGMLNSLYNNLSEEEVRFGAPFNYIHKKSIPCKVGHKTVMVNPFGNVIPCDSFKDIAVGRADNNLGNKGLLKIIKESDLFEFARRNSMITCESECCLGQFLLEEQKKSFKIVSHA